MAKPLRVLPDSWPKEEMMYARQSQWLMKLALLQSFIICICICSCSSQPTPKEPWEVISSFGNTKIVYMPSKYMEDKRDIVKVIQKLRDRQGKIVEILFFDDKAHTPHRFPMSDRQMLHYRARYSFNPNSGLEEFIMIEIVDSMTSPPELKEIRIGGMDF